MAEYLSDEELVERIKRWWSENGTGLLVGIVLAVGGVVGWRWFDGWRLERAEAASDVFAQFIDARAAGEDSAALAAHLAEEFPSSAYRVLALLHQARDAIEAEEAERAAELLRESIELASEDVLRDVGRVRLARVLHQLGQPDEALATLAAVNGRGFASAVAELTGDIQWQRGALDEAREAYRAALADPPSEQASVLVRLKLASVPPGPAMPEAEAMPEAGDMAEAAGEDAAGAEAASPTAPAEPEAQPPAEAAEDAMEAVDTPETGESDQ